MESLGVYLCPMTTAQQHIADTAADLGLLPADEYETGRAFTYTLNSGLEVWAPKKAAEKITRTFRERGITGTLHIVAAPTFDRDRIARADFAPGF